MRICKDDLVKHYSCWFSAVELGIHKQLACRLLAMFEHYCALSFWGGWRGMRSWLKSREDWHNYTCICMKSKAAYLLNAGTQFKKPFFNFVFCISGNNLMTVVWLLWLKTLKCGINIEMFWVAAFVLCISHSVLHSAFFSVSQARPPPNQKKGESFLVTWSFLFLCELCPLFLLLEPQAYRTVFC